jgi:hypothetical protein
MILLQRLIFIAFLLLCGCILPGTGTGNPKEPSSNVDSRTTESGRIFSAVCEKLSECYPLLQSSCANDLSTLETFGPKLGISNPTPLTVNEIVSHEYNGNLIPDSVAATSCRQQLGLLNCSDASVLAAYDPSALEPLGLAHEMLDPVCANVFQ